MDREKTAAQGWRDALHPGIVSAAYFVTGWLGLHLPHGDMQITLVWLPTGIAVAALYRWGYRCWPAIPVASILVNVLFGAAWSTALLISIGNTLGPLLSALLLRRAGFHPAFDRQRDVVILLMAGATGMLLPATGGVAAFRATGVLPAELWAQAWGTWFLGDAMGVLLGAPLLLAYGQNICHDALPRHAERVVWWVTAAAVALAYLVVPTPEAARVAVLFLPLAVVVWSALRFGVCVSSVFTLGLSLLAAWGLALGHGPLQAVDVHAGLRLLWGYLATLIVLGLMIAALRAERSRAMQQLRESEDRYERLFRMMPLPMAVLELETERFLDVNDAAVAACGYSREECLRMTARDFDPDDSPVRFAAVFDGPLPVIGRQLRYRVRDGHVMTVELSGQKIEYGGRPAVLTVTRDVTDEVDLDRAVLDAGNRERHHLSEELHDGLGQDLTGLALLGSGLASSARRDGLAVADEIERLAQIARHAVSTCRQIARGLSPLSEGHGGLVRALGDMTERLQDGHGPAIAFRVHGEGAAQLPRETADHLYRIAQEALTNALKHAGARQVDIVLEIEPSRLRLTVTDDGGRPPAGTVSIDAMGLRIMRHRAAAIGAELVAGPAEHGGWRVVCDGPRPAVGAVPPGPRASGPRGIRSRAPADPSRFSTRIRGAVPDTMRSCAAVGVACSRDPRALAKPSFQFSEIDLRRIDHAVGGFCTAHRPRSAEPYVRRYHRVRGASVVLVEDRRHYLDEARWVTVPIARLCFDADHRQWTLQWRRASGRWAAYPGGVPTTNLDQLLQEIARDPERLFWG